MPYEYIYMLSQVITQEADASQAGLAGTTAPLSSHSSTIYLPPLPPPLLPALGLGPGARRDALQAVETVHEVNLQARTVTPLQLQP